MVCLIAKRTIKVNSALNALTATDLLPEKYCKPEIITIFTRPAPGVPNVGIHLEMVKKCIFKVS